MNILSVLFPLDKAQNFFWKGCLPMDYPLYIDNIYEPRKINSVPISRSCPSFLDGSQPLGRRRPPTSSPIQDGQKDPFPLGMPLKPLW